MAQRQFADALLGLIERNRIGLIYCHKPHTLLLLEPLLPSLRGLRIALDLHDDFVARDGDTQQPTHRSSAPLPGKTFCASILQCIYATGSAI